MERLMHRLTGYELPARSSATLWQSHGGRMDAGGFFLSFLLFFFPSYLFPFYYSFYLLYEDRLDEAGG